MIRLFRLIAALAGVSGLWLLALASPAGADAVLVASSPSAGAIVGGDVVEVQIVFNELVTGGDIAIEGPDGSVALLGQTREGQVLSARFEPLTIEGRYSIRYSLISADTDPVAGSIGFDFRVDGPAPLPVSVPAIETGASPLLVGAVTIGLAVVVMLAGQTFLRTQRLRQLRSSDGVPSDR